MAGYCGRTGCIETFVSGPGLARDFLATTGRTRYPQVILVEAEFGDPAALAALHRYEHRLARRLAHVINILDPAVIVLGGGMSNVARLYTRIPQLWGEFVFSDAVVTRLVRPTYGDASGARGACVAVAGRNTRHPPLMAFAHRPFPRQPAAGTMDAPASL